MIGSTISRQIFSTSFKRFFSTNKYPLKVTLVETKVPHLKIKIENPALVPKIIEALETKHYTLITPNGSGSSAPSVIPQQFRDIFLL